MPTRSSQAKYDSPPSSGVKVYLPVRTPIQLPSTKLLVQQTRPKRTSHEPAKPQTHPLHYKAPFQLPRPRPDFGPPSVPTGGSICTSSNRRSTSHPLRDHVDLSSSNTASEWKQTSRKAISTKMNPMASSFAPKPTYAQTVKASLPQRNAREGSMDSTAPIEEEAETPAIVDGSRTAMRPTENLHYTSHLTREHGGRHDASGETSRGTSVSRGLPPTPRIQVTMESEKSHVEPNVFTNPLAQRPDHQQASYPHNWYTGYHAQQSPTPFLNPIAGAYGPHPPIPGGEYLHPGYYHPQFVPGSPVIWDPSAAAALIDYHRTQSAQGMYGPFPPPPPPPISPHEMHHSAHTPYPVLPFAPLPGWAPGQPMSSQCMETYTTPAPQQQPEQPKRSPSRGKKFQLVRETQRARLSRVREKERAEAQRHGVDDHGAATPVLQESDGSLDPSARSRAQPAAEAHQEFSPRPELEMQVWHPKVTPVEQRGRTRYRLVSARSKVRTDKSDRRLDAGSDSNDSALMFGDDKPDPRDLNNLSKHTIGDNSRAFPLRDHSPTPNHDPVKADGPPPNAPTGPASLRRFANMQHFRTSRTPKPAEQGSWSQSKRWVSQETKERTAFQKLMHNLHYMGADKSPFIPSTPAELTEFKIAQADRKSKSMAETLRRMEERRYRRRKAQEEGTSEGDERPELFGGKKMHDSLSPFFAQESCFNNEVPPQDSELVVDWPSRGELKEEGDRRATRYGRYFPLPRLNIVATRILQEESESPYNDDGTISWEKKAVKNCSRFIQPVTSELEPPIYEPVQFDIRELHGPLRHLLKEVDEIGVDGNARR